MRLPTSASLGIAALGVLLLAAVPSNATPVADGLHFELDRSSPEADSTVPSPGAIVLWFTQVPQDDATSVRLIDAAGEPVETGELVQDPEDRSVFVLPVGTPLAPGSYTVTWRSMAADGHVVRGDFGFTVDAASDAGVGTGDGAGVR